MTDFCFCDINSLKDSNETQISFFETEKNVDNNKYVCSIAKMIWEAEGENVYYKNPNCKYSTNFNIKTGDFFAMKCMKKKYTSLESINALREIRALKRLSTHKNIISLISTALHSLYISMIRPI